MPNTCCKAVLMERQILNTSARDARQDFGSRKAALPQPKSTFLCKKGVRLGGHCNSRRHHTVGISPGCTLQGEAQRGLCVKTAQDQVFLGSAPGRTPAPSPRPLLLHAVSLKAAPRSSSCPLKPSPPDSSRKALRFATTHAAQNTAGCCHAEHTLFSFFKTSRY